VTGGAATLRPVDTYVAIGDSFTEGPDCPPERRWADRLAASLREVNPDLHFENLAVEGAPSGDVLAGQLERALELKPDLASIICGANDVLLSVRPDIDAYAENMHTMLDRLIEANPRVALFTATIPAGWETLEMRPRTRRRVVENLIALNERTRQIAAERSLPLLDVALHPQLPDPENFGSDGLHPSELGHERAARAFRELVAELLERRDRGELDHRRPTATTAVPTGGGRDHQLGSELKERTA
jgi:lysophospholipase L1-like esterase